MNSKKNLSKEASEITVNTYEVVNVSELVNSYKIEDDEESDITSTNETIRIALIDDDIFNRSALKSVISNHPIEIVIEEGFGKRMEDKFKNIPEEDEIPKLIIVSGDTEFTKSYESTKWLKDNFYKPNIIYLSETNEKEEILKLLKLGIKSIIFRKNHTVESVMSEILKLLNQEREYVYDDYTIKMMLDSLEIKANKPERIALPKTLSDRDKDVIKMIIEEKKGIDIAKELNLNARTIEGIVNGLFSKFGVSTRVGIAVKAVKGGLFE